MWEGAFERSVVENVIWGPGVPAVIRAGPSSIVQYTVLIKCELCGSELDGAIKVEFKLGFKFKSQH